MLRKLLLDDVGLDGHAQMICLAGQIGREVVVFILLECVVAQVAPQNRAHAELMGVRKGPADLDNLAVALL